LCGFGVQVNVDGDQHGLFGEFPIARGFGVYLHVSSSPNPEL
jgi:hypothetical protein